MADRSRERSASRSRSRSRDPVAEGEVVPATDAVKSEEVQDATNGEVNDAGAVDNNNAGDGDGAMDAAPVEIYIGNLDFNTRDQDLEDEFRKEVPNLIEARVVMDKFDNRRSRGFAFAKVATQEEADKLIAKYNEFELGGRTIRVNIAGQKSERPSNRVTTSNSGGPGETELYVGSLAWETTDADLQEAFGKHGTVLSARVVMDRHDPTKSRGFAFIKASTLAEATEMVTQLNGAELMGRNLKVNIATGKSDRPPKQGGRGGYGGGGGGGGYGGNNNYGNNSYGGGRGGGGGGYGGNNNGGGYGNNSYGGGRGGGGGYGGGYNNGGGGGGGGGCPKPENELWPHEGVGQVTLDIRKGVTIILPSEKLIDKRLHQIQLSTGIVPNVSFRQYIDERGEKSWRWLEMEIDQPHVGHRREKDDAKRARERYLHFFIYF